MERAEGSTELLSTQGNEVEGVIQESTAMQSSPDNETEEGTPAEQATQQSSSQDHTYAAIGTQTSFTAGNTDCG